MIRYSRFAKIFVSCFCIFFVFILITTAIMNNWNTLLCDLAIYLILGISGSLLAAIIAI